MGKRLWSVFLYLMVDPKSTTSDEGDVVHLNMMGQHMIFLNSPEAAVDLLEKRSNIYSDRIYLPMLNDL